MNRPNARRYYSLLTRENETSDWTIQFGSFDLTDVEMEREDMLQAHEGPKKRNTKIIETFAAQASILAKVCLLNTKVRA